MFEEKINSSQKVQLLLLIKLQKMRKNIKSFLVLVCLSFYSTMVLAQVKTITGVVQDDKGNPLPGASVREVGSRRTVLSDANGAFSLPVKPGAALAISYVGYQDTRIQTGEGSSYNITLQSNVSTLNMVVVTALGIAKESRKLGYAVTTISGDQFTKARETNVALSLEGQVAGLNVHGTSGGAGGTARILLRGMPSINSGGSPLFVVNGVPIDNSSRGSAGEWGGSDKGDGIQNLNPDDIATMTVLKGQAASALYGARASNGVILITTKTGQKGAPLIEYNGNYSVDQPLDLTDFQYQYGQGQNGVKPGTISEAQNTARFAWGARMDGSSLTQFDGKQYPYSPYKDNIEHFYRTAPTFTNTVSVSGGGDNGTYRLSLSNLDNKSIVRNSGLTRRTVNFNLNQKIIDKLSVTITANYLDQSDKNKPSLSDGPGNPNNGFFLAPNINEAILKPGYDANGNEIVFSDDNYVTNPWFVVNKWVNDQDRKRLITSIAPRYNFTPWLYIMARLGYDRINDRYKGVTPSGTNYEINAQGQSGDISISTVQTTELNLDGIIGVSHKLAADISLDATIGGNIRKNQDETVQIGGGPFVIPNLYTPTNVVNYNRSYGFHSKEVHSGYYSVDLSFKNFLTLNTTGRYDAYSTLYNSSIPKNKRNIFTPSVSGGLVFSQLVNIPKLDFGKLRLSYAQTSGEPSQPYQTATYYSVGSSINGTPTGNYSSTLPNLFLKPFTVTEVEVGTELRFLQSRLGFDIAYYNRKTKNEIMNGSLSQSTGYSSYVVANGSVQNKGLEILVTGKPVATRNFEWNISVNATSVANKVLQTDLNGNNLGLGTYRPLNATTGFVKGMSGPQILANDYQYDSKGTIIVDSLSGKPLIGNRVAQGSVLPTFYGGVKNDFTYKGFNLSFLIDFNYGNKILSATKFYAVYRGLDKSTLVGRETGVSVSGVTASGTPITKTVAAQAYYQNLAAISKTDVLSGDFIKLRQVTLGYTIPEKAFAGIPVIRSIQISLVGRNLAILMKKSDNIDPEAEFAAGINYAGIEGTSLPTTRTFGINANIKFKN